MPLSHQGNNPFSASTLFLRKSSDSQACPIPLFPLSPLCHLMSPDHGSEVHHTQDPGGYVGMSTGEWELEGHLSILPDRDEVALWGPRANRMKKPRGGRREGGTMRAGPRLGSPEGGLRMCLCAERLAALFSWGTSGFHQALVQFSLRLLGSVQGPGVSGMNFPLCCATLRGFVFCYLSGCESPSVNSDAGRFYFLLSINQTNFCLQPLST